VLKKEEQKFKANKVGEALSSCNYRVAGRNSLVAGEKLRRAIYVLRDFSVSYFQLCMPIVCSALDD